MPLEVHIQGYPNKLYCPRMATMNKPAYAAIQTYSPIKPVLVFVSSRRQTRLTALDLLGYAAADEQPRQFVHMPEHELEAVLATVKVHNWTSCCFWGVLWFCVPARGCVGARGGGACVCSSSGFSVSVGVCVYVRACACVCHWAVCVGVCTTDIRLLEELGLQCIIQGMKVDERTRCQGGRCYCSLF